jgi:4-hydroxy-tetrahydrodipicolinate synthase
MDMSNELRGVFSAMVTPTRVDGSVDEAELRNVVDRAIEQGVDGLVPCGSTGEFTSLTNAERRLVVETVIDQAAGRAAVVPHTGALTTVEAVGLSRHASDAGATGVLVIAPFYEPLELDEIRGFYEAVSDAVEVPVGVYNLPPATGINLEPAWVAQLASEVERVSFIKDSTGDFTQLGRLVADHGDQLTIFNGADPLLLHAFDLGVDGAIIGAPNLFGAECAAVYDLWAEGRHEEARATLQRIYPVLQFLVSGGYYAALVKGGLELLDLPAGAPRLPILPLRGERLEQLRGILATIGSQVAAA